eukprot:TRINITY_DN85663_c0_g1_i1.p1 TRINITY_DN85663_c0_g1~~TRINITY_DN85663_c0_g1_i1.p1  ORF type:complete len:198 (+),score=75.78 TRINITY_DN85663_c0_g1_i1:3-596(+)
MMDGRVEKFMALALEEARRALTVREVPVGCVFVHTPSDRVLAAAHNLVTLERNATRHAELVAVDAILEQCGDEGVFGECELFVTCEPCVMCASALRLLGIRKVYFGCSNERFGGCGSVFTLHQGNDPLAHLGKKKEKDEDDDAKKEDNAAQPLCWSNDGYECVGGIRADEAVELFKSFYAAGNPIAPDAKRKRPLLQ